VHPYAAPQSWLGAYYTLRQDGPLKCERAIANREKLKGKNAPARSRFIVSAIEKLQIDELVKKDPWRGAAKSEHGIQSGETLEVWYKPSADQPEERVVGYCIARHNRGLGSSFRILCMIDQCPIEYQFQLFSPMLLNIITRAPRRKTQRSREKFGRIRSKLYFLRDEVDKLKLPKPTPRPRSDAASKAKKK
jgi:ribosomal protein L19